MYYPTERTDNENQMNSKGHCVHVIQKLGVVLFIDQAAQPQNDDHVRQQQQMEPQQMELLLTDQLLQTVLPLMHLPVLTQALIQALPVQVLLQEMLLPLLEILSLPLWMHTVHRSNMSRHMMQTATK